ncbi:DUF6483 family protein [Candidatus Contubernalis alkaliaceticus]|uniref:DUF6483 family protein n=1 Tax=Candidatus Contubernalis alkaliaceticus TaxID=338645 RepID=UPI001F4BE01F|nr:DUF6483 family protein [Candidatus Contubernalis alkalaceticus]UNC92160.1 hypothetical protein HUE98_08670 [Candidatus Contubernalis alkalaceticus]
MFNNDYIMREIENLSKAAVRFFKKDIITIEIFDEQENISDSGFLYYRLKKLIQDRKINEAEDLLFEEVERNRSKEHLKVAIAFFKDLNELTDETLLNCDYSRNEIYEGIQAVQKYYRTPK